jgi:hypothetical protein
VEGEWGARLLVSSHPARRWSTDQNVIFDINSATKADPSRSD